MDLVEAVEQEEQHCAAVCNRPIFVPVLVDGHFRLLGCLNLLSDLICNALALLQRFDECHVLGEVPFGSAQLVEEAILQLLELDRELSVLDDEVGLGFLQVGALFVYHKGEELVLESLLCHSEVDERCLSLDLGAVVWVGELCVHEELEVFVELDFFVSQLDVVGTALLERGSSHHRVDNSINGLIHVLDEDRVARLHCSLHGGDHRWRPHPEHHKVVLALPLLDPDNAL
mmetsp:Transcript_32484/g.77090  ORF Transcript_32484/g.77090 Transcript_32484/m.77090 type:complete len:230 (+) Transcript_32484:2947-3636(+)